MPLVKKKGLSYKSIQILVVVWVTNFIFFPYIPTPIKSASLTVSSSANEHILRFVKANRKSQGQSHTNRFWYLQWLIAVSSLRGTFGIQVQELIANFHYDF